MDNREGDQEQDSMRLLPLGLSTQDFEDGRKLLEDCVPESSIWWAK
jgi:hypothetical protein